MVVGGFILLGLGRGSLGCLLAYRGDRREGLGPRVCGVPLGILFAIGGDGDESRRRYISIGRRLPGEETVDERDGETKQRGGIWDLQVFEVSTSIR